MMVGFGGGTVTLWACFGGRAGAAGRGVRLSAGLRGSDLLLETG